MHTHPIGIPSTILFSSPREERISAEHRRMRQNLGDVISAYPALSPYGSDPLVDQLLRAHGFDHREAFTMRLSVTGDYAGRETGRFVTAVIVSSRAWHRAGELSLLLQVKAEAAADRTRCILVPQKYLAGPNRLASAKLIARSGNVTCTASDRMFIIGHVLAEGWSTLADCAACIPRHRDPAGAVLAMVARGDLKIDRFSRIGPHSRIDLAS